MDDKIYSVAVSCRGVNGWVEYDTEAKTVKVFLDDEKAVADAEKFLSEKHVIKVPHESLLLHRGDLRSFGRRKELPDRAHQTVGEHRGSRGLESSCGVRS